MRENVSVIQTREEEREREIVKDTKRKAVMGVRELEREIEREKCYKKKTKREGARQSVREAQSATQTTFNSPIYIRMLEVLK